MAYPNKYNYPTNEKLLYLFSIHGSVRLVAEQLDITRGSLKSYINNRPELAAEVEKLKVNRTKKYDYPSDDELVAMVKRHRTVTAVGNILGVKQTVLRSYIIRRPKLDARIREVMAQDYHNKERQKEDHRKHITEWGKKNRTRKALAAHRRRQLIREQGKLYEDNIEFVDLLRYDPCSYCGKPAKENRHGISFVDHIIPLSKGGDHNWTNFTASCNDCNVRKGTKDLLSFLLETKEVSI